MCCFKMNLLTLKILNFTTFKPQKPPFTKQNLVVLNSLYDI